MTKWGGGKAACDPCCSIVFLIVVCSSGIWKDNMDLYCIVYVFMFYVAWLLILWSLYLPLHSTWCITWLPCPLQSHSSFIHMWSCRALISARQSMIKDKALPSLLIEVYQFEHSVRLDTLSWINLLQRNCWAHGSSQMARHAWMGPSCFQCHQSHITSPLELMVLLSA